MPHLSFTALANPRRGNAWLVACVLLAASVIAVELINPKPPAAPEGCAGLPAVWRWWPPSLVGQNLGEHARLCGRGGAHHRWRHFRGAHAHGTRWRGRNPRAAAQHRCGGAACPLQQGAAPGARRARGAATAARRGQRHAVSRRAGQISRTHRRQRRDPQYQRYLGGDALRRLRPRLRRRAAWEWCRSRRRNGSDYSLLVLP